MSDDDSGLEKKIDQVNHALDLHQKDCEYHRKTLNNILHGVRESITEIKKWQRWSSIFAYIIGVILLIAYLFGVEGIQHTVDLASKVKP